MTQRRCGVFAVVLMVVALGSVPPAFAGKRLPKHITPETEAAIQKGLQYLARQQGRDGAWRSAGNMGSYPVSMTSLAGLAFLAHGDTTTQGKYAAKVDRATRYLMASATNSGLIARGGGESRPMYGHGFSMLFLGQLYGMTENPRRQDEVKQILTRGIQLTGQAQSRLGGWIYTPNSGSDEGSVTITQVQALRACRNAGIHVPKSVIDQAMEYLKISTNSDGGIAYRAGQRGPSRAPITAAAVCCWFNAGQYKNPLALKALEFCKEHITTSFGRVGHWFYAHFYMSQAMYLAGDKEWDGYFPQLRDELLKRQAEDGSWEDRSVGKVYGTALALVMLQLPYDALPIMQR